eukprot:364001-Chlamydomonas_euryale.AAC.10
MSDPANAASASICAPGVLPTNAMPTLTRNAPTSSTPTAAAASSGPLRRVSVHSIAASAAHAPALFAST